MLVMPCKSVENTSLLHVRGADAAPGIVPVKLRAAGALIALKL
jgi:hypothetical protein